MEEPKRYIWKNEQADGPYTVDELYRMAKRGSIDYTTYFYSDTQQAWLTLPPLMFDVEPNDLDRKREIGIKFIEILDSGTGEDCPACSALAGQRYAIYSVPEIPPPDCTCNPWCRPIYTAAE